MRVASEAGARSSFLLHDWGGKVGGGGKHVMPKRLTSASVRSPGECDEKPGKGGNGQRQYECKIARHHFPISPDER